VAFEDRVNLLFLEQGNVFLRLFAKRKKKLRPQQCTMTHTAAKLECCTGFSGGTEVTDEGLKAGSTCYF
jgi:hypothetical protein